MSTQKPFCMPLCRFCLENEADKTNTHYLTDAVIRSALNEDGKNLRGKGYMFDLSNQTPFIEFKFQQETSLDGLTKAYGRDPNEEEIENAK